MNSYPSWNLHVDAVQEWAYFDNALSSTECDEIVEYCKQFKMEEGKIADASLDHSIRKSTICMIPPTEYMVPYYRKFSAIVHSLNEQFFKFDLHGFDEHLQFTEYTAPEGKYDSHPDRAYGIPVRKLSIVVQLTDPDTYEGGDFEWIRSIELPLVLPRTRGTLIAFPSYQLHRVTQLTKGTRNSLVGWISGKQFK